MHNNRRPFALDQTKHAFPVANIDFVILVPRDGLFQSPQRPGGITFRTKEHGALIVVDTKHRVACLVKCKQTSEPINPQDPVTRTRG